MQLSSFNLVFISQLMTVSYLYILQFCVLYSAKSLQLYLTLFYPVDYGLPGSSVHRILWARILEQLPFPSPRDLPNPGI